MGLPSYVINFDEMAEMLDLHLDTVKGRKLKNYAGEMRKESFYVEIPAIVNRYRIFRWEPSQDVVLTSVSFSQTAWKSVDSWGFYVDGIPILNNIYTKELTDKKTWDVLREVPQGTEIQLLLNNRSGNHRGVWVEIEYIEKVGVSA